MVSAAVYYDISTLDCVAWSLGCIAWMYLLCYSTCILAMEPAAYAPGMMSVWAGGFKRQRV